MLGNLTNIAEAEDLEAAGIGENRPFPLHKIVQIAMQLHDFLTRAQPQVESVAENNLRAGRFHFFRRHAFHGTVSTHRHKGWRFHYATIKHQTTATRTTIGGI